MNLLLLTCEFQKKEAQAGNVDLILNNDHNLFPFNIFYIICFKLTHFLLYASESEALIK